MKHMSFMVGRHVLFMNLPEQIVTESIILYHGKPLKDCFSSEISPALLNDGMQFKLHRMLWQALLYYLVSFLCGALNSSALR